MPAFIIGGATLAAGALGYMGSESANRANTANAQAATAASAEQAQRQMDFQERMARNSYQYAVNDMERAGLNPMLAYSQGGAATPSGAQGQVFQPAPMQNKMQAGIGSAQQAAGAGQTVAQTGLLDAQKQNVEADTVMKVASAGHLDALKDNVRQEMTSFNTRLEKLIHETKSAEFGAWEAQTGYEIAKDLSYGNKIDPHLVHKSPRIQVMLAEAEKLAQQAKLLGLEVPKAVSEAAMWSSEYGKKLPYIESGTHSFGNLTGALRNLSPLGLRAR